MIYIRKATLCKKSKEQNQRIQGEENREKTKKERKPNNKLLIERKRAKKRRERNTSRESPCPRPIKKSSTKVNLGITQDKPKVIKTKLQNR